MPSGSPMGYGDVAGRVNTIQQSLAVAGFFALEFPQEYQAFSFEISGGAAALRSVTVGFGTPDIGGISSPAAAQDVLDPVAFAGVKNLTRWTRWVYVYVASATAGATLSVTGVQGDPVPRNPSAADIAAALAGLVVTATLTGPIPITAVVWGASTPVAMGAASAVIAAAAVRKKFIIQNTGGVVVAVRLAAAAAVFANDLLIPVGGAYQESGEGQGVYQGEIRGITGGAAGEVRFAEAL